MSDHHDAGQEHDPGPRVGLSPFAARSRVLAALLVEKGVLTQDEIRRQVAATERRSPETGARIVARAWVDPRFAALLREDFAAAVAQVGVDASGLVQFEALFNTETVHNVVVCTLCSCYPRAIIGNPPDWYKSTAYRSRTVREPRAVLAEFGLHLPPEVTVRVHDSTADLRYLVVPRRPSGSEGLSEEELAALVSRDCLIGVAVAASPVAA
ncbi:MAG TPA: nitrile hydratase subunit alpha [Actinomycetales bacterium]|nr:nitrile hydratase subunit alpha [Actinomycetales bacterium]